MTNELTKEIIEERFIHEDIGAVAQEFFGDVKYSRRISTAVRAVRDLGYIVSNNGMIVKGRAKKPEFEILTDSRNRPYAKLSGLSRRGARTGLSGLFFPSNRRKEFMVSLRSWGKSGLNLHGVRRDNIEVTTNGVRIHLDYIEIVPDRKWLPKFMIWMKELKLPLRD